MRTYYRGPDAVVTSDVFVWRTTPAQVFAIRDLSGVGIARGDAGRYGPSTAHVAGGSLVLVAATWPMWNTPGLRVLGVLVLALPGVVAAACWRLRPRCWELHAEYRGVPTLIYLSLDPRVFNQVSRALRRSMEDNRPDWADGGDATAA
jgi:hypothetical protein